MSIPPKRNQQQENEKSDQDRRNAITQPGPQAQEVLLRRTLMNLSSDQKVIIRETENIKTNQSDQSKKIDQIWNALYMPDGIHAQLVQGREKFDTLRFKLESITGGPDFLDLRDAIKNSRLFNKYIAIFFGALITALAGMVAAAIKYLL